jgi:CheY-like chemotaxis protein
LGIFALATHAPVQHITYMQTNSSVFRDRLAEPVVCKVLVVEDETLNGLDIMATLSGAGIQSVGPYPTVGGALAAIEGRTFDAALVDINLNGVPSFHVAATLRRKEIPFAFVTAYDPIVLLEELRSVPLLRKPYNQYELLSVARGLLGIAQA